MKLSHCSILATEAKDQALPSTVARFFPRRLLTLLLALFSCLWAIAQTQGQATPKQLQFLENFLNEKGEHELTTRIDDQEITAKLVNGHLACAIDGQDQPLDALLPYLGIFEGAIEELGDAEEALQDQHAELEHQKDAAARLEVEAQDLRASLAELEEERERHQLQKQAAEVEHEPRMRAEELAREAEQQSQQAGILLQVRNQKAEAERQADLAASQQEAAERQRDQHQHGQAKAQRAR